MQPTDARDSLARLLAEIVTAAANAGVSLPDRQYYTVGGSVWDCEQVVTSILSIDTGLTNTRDGLDSTAFLAPGYPTIWNARIEMGIVRCAAERPTGARGDRPPDVAKVMADADQQSTDICILVTALESCLSEIGMPLAPIQFFQPEGGMVGVVLTTTINLGWLGTTNA